MEELHEYSKEIIKEFYLKFLGEHPLQDQFKRVWIIKTEKEEKEFTDVGATHYVRVSPDIFDKFREIIRDNELDLWEATYGEGIGIYKRNGNEDKDIFSIVYEGQGIDYHGYEQVGGWYIDDVDINEIINTIDIAKLGASIGMEAKEQTLPNGKVVKSLVWDKENLLKAVDSVKHLSTEGKPVRITGAAPAWLVSALTHAVHPCPVTVYVPAIGKDVRIPQLEHGEINPEGEVNFKTTEKGSSVLIEYDMNLPEGITTYDENNVSKVVVPDIAQGKSVYISGRGPNYLTTAIAEAYAHTNSSVSLFQPGVGYTCAITHSREKNLGDLIKDPLEKEKIKEDLIDSKNKENSIIK